MQFSRVLSVLAALVALALGAWWLQSARQPVNAPGSGSFVHGSQEHGSQAGVAVVDGFVLAVPPGASVSSAYFTLRNGSDAPLSLHRVSSPLAAQVTLMQTAEIATAGSSGSGHAHHHSLKGMQRLTSLDIPAGEEVTLTPGSTHLMLDDLVRVPREGEQVELTLYFTDHPAEHLAGLKVLLPVRRFE